MKPEELVKALESEGYDPYAYSGRCMYGRECVGVNVDNQNDSWILAQRLAERGLRPPPPRQDSMGRGLVLYWSGFEWPRIPGDESVEEPDYPPPHEGAYL